MTGILIWARPHNKGGTVAVEPKVELALDFLNRLYANTTDPGYITLFTVDHETGQRSTAWAPIDRLGDLSDAIMRFGSRGNTWFGVAPRRAQLDDGRRGGVSDCMSISAFWVDVDVASEAHKLPGLPKDFEEAKQLILSYPLRPSAIVHSGYGYQAWWLLREQLPAPDAINLLARWWLTWERLADQRSVHLDNVANLDRVMRLPGTLNWKLAERGLDLPRVAFRMLGRGYEHSEVIDTLDALPEPTEKRRSPTTHLAGSRFNELVPAKELLLSVGCTLAHVDANGDEHYHFPNASNDVSCTVYAEDGHCSVWSETMAAATGLELRTP